MLSPAVHSPANRYHATPPGFAPKPASRRPVSVKSPPYTIARYALDVSNGRRPLPLVTDTLPLAEDFRRELLRKCWGLARRAGGKPSRQEICVRFPSITGKD